VLGNTSTTHGRWYGNLLIGTDTNSTFALDVVGTARTTGDISVNGVNIGRGGSNRATNTITGASAGVGNTSGIDNSFFGNLSGNLNTSGQSNSFFGSSAGFSNTTGSSNIYIGVASGRSNTSGGSNLFFGNSSGRFIADGTTVNAISNQSIYIGNVTKANANNETNQIVIGHDATGLGSNTTVIGNSSTTFGRWFGNLLIGTSTNNGTNLRVVGTTQSDIITQNLASHGVKVLQYTSVSSTTINLPTEFPLMTGLVVANSYAVFGKYVGKNISYAQAIEFYISKNPNGFWNTVAYSNSSQFMANLVDVTGSGNDLTITTSMNTSFTLELTVMTQS
jgi:hypothetical protein